MFLMKLLLLLNEQSLDNVSDCPECGKIFYRIRRQKYCSPKCTNTATVRAYRKSETGELNEEKNKWKATVRKLVKKGHNRAFIMDRIKNQINIQKPSNEEIQDFITQHKRRIRKKEKINRSAATRE
jgi:hypothetical protein